MTASVSMSVLLAAAVMLPLGGSAHRKTAEGNRHYSDGAYEDALRAYTEAQVSQPEAPELYYDIGNVLFRQEDFEGAAEAYTRALLSAGEHLTGPAAYNLGNARFEMQQYDAAVSAYERALRADPGDADAKRNLELALRALDERPQSEQQQAQQGDEGQENEEGDSSESESSQGEEEERAGNESGADEEEQGAETEEQAGGDASDEQAASESGSEEQPSGKMTSEQAERMLDGLAEQEMDNLREGALQKRPSSAKSPEVDW